MLKKKIRLVTITTNEEYIMDGVKVFEGFDTERTCRVKDPEYGKSYAADIYEITGLTKKFNVAFAEFSPCVYGIYLIE